MWRWFRWVLLSFGIIIALGALALIQPWVFLPHGNAEIALPFAPEDDQHTEMIPMGEIEQWHNASTGLPNGHPGIDFQWNKVTNILAIGDGRIINIRKNNEDKYIVEQRLGLFYHTVYQELNTIEPDIKFLSKVKKGQKIGTSGFVRTNFNNEAPKPTDPSPQIHWDFMSSSLLKDRLCPVNHFDSDSIKRIEAIWARVKAKGQFKPQYPDICNGYYKNKED